MVIDDATGDVRDEQNEDAEASADPEPRLDRDGVDSAIEPHGPQSPSAHSSEYDQSVHSCRRGRGHAVVKKREERCHHDDAEQVTEEIERPDGRLSLIHI